jgi:SAM-dependent methyltransferase
MKAGHAAPADEIGFSTLINISGAHHLNNWLFETIRPFINGRVLEIGSGIGNISSIFVNRRIPLSLSDYSEAYCELLRNKFSSVPYVKDIFRIDLTDKDFETRHASILGSFDTLFALNVIEHIEDDGMAVENCYKLLAPGGRLIVMMPAYQGLYNEFDRALGHYRRHTRATMNKLLSRRFELVRTWYFNLGGIVGWWLFGTVLHKKMISRRQMDIYEKLIPLFRFADWITFRRAGLSVFGVGRKK